MSRSVVIVLGLVAVIVLALVGGGLFLGVRAARALPSPPDQPIGFSHQIHVTIDQIDCTFCHRNVEKGAAATLPAVEQCLFCHQVAGLDKEEVQVLRGYWERQEPIDWVRVYRLPDTVRFVHEPHIRVLSERQGIGPSAVCATCHGDVATMNSGTISQGNLQPLGQFRRLDMGECLACHRQNNAPTDCAICHY